MGNRILQNRRFVPPPVAQPPEPGTLDYATPEPLKSYSWIARKWRRFRSEYFTKTTIKGIVVGFVFLYILARIFHALFVLTHS